MNKVIVSGGFDNLNSSDMRFLEEAAKHGTVHAILWADSVIDNITGNAPKFPLVERKYFLNAIRYVNEIEIQENDMNPDTLPSAEDVASWVVYEKDDTPEKQNFCKENNIDYIVVTEDQLNDRPTPTSDEIAHSDKKKVVVTGCYDWFHTGHVRFFEEVSELGDLYVCLGSDATVEELKGEGHPMFKEDERWYMVQSIRFVKQALINSGSGWLDAEPELKRIKPDIYAVNEDGDKPEKKEYCEANDIEYVILKRTPAEGLPRRESTHLRGF